MSIVLPGDVINNTFWYLGTINIKSGKVRIGDLESVDMPITKGKVNFRGKVNFPEVSEFALKNGKYEIYYYQKKLLNWGNKIMGVLILDSKNVIKNSDVLVFKK